MSSNIVRLNSWRPYTVSMGDDIMKILWALTVLHSWGQLDYSTSINLSAQPELKLGKTFPKTFGLKGSCCRINTSQEVGQMSSCYLGQTTNITLLRTMANMLLPTWLWNIQMEIRTQRRCTLAHKIYAGTLICTVQNRNMNIFLQISSALKWATSRKRHQATNTALTKTYKQAFNSEQL